MDSTKDTQGLEKVISALEKLVQLTERVESLLKQNLEASQKSSNIQLDPILLEKLIAIYEEDPERVIDPISLENLSTRRIIRKALKYLEVKGKLKLVGPNRYQAIKGPLNVYVSHKGRRPKGDLERRILEKFTAEPQKMFEPKNFIDLGTIEAVSKMLSKLARGKVIFKVGRSTYQYKEPKYDLLKMEDRLAKSAELSLFGKEAMKA